MANSARGEVDLEIPHDTDPSLNRTLTLFLSTNAICEMQSRTKQTYGQILRSIEDLDYTNFRELVWAALKRHHVKQFPNVERVGDLIDDASRWRVQAAMMQLFVLNMPPKAEETTPEVGPDRPTEATDGTGNGSTPMAVATA
jgi:hypothetical protein